jgi:hypothetical protein
MTLAYSDADAKWSPIKLRKFDSKKGNGEYVDFTLADDEELNAETLNALKTALDDLKIVDVKRKPQGLSENLKAGEDFMGNREALQDLMSKGFAATASPDGKSQEIISSDGEVIATLKNGAEYVLRFGNLTNVAGAGQDKDDKAGDAKSTATKPGDKKSDKSDVHRYLFVMARLNKDAVKQPELVKLPDLPAKTEAAAAPPNADDSAEGKKTDAATPEAEKAKSEEKNADAGKPADAAAKEAANAEKKDADKSDKKDDAAAKEGGADKELEKVIAERQQIEKENQRKLDEYQALLKKGEQSVKDLNLRFGDWYFVVNDDVFQKVRVSRDKVIKKKEKKAEGQAAPGQAGPGAPPTGIPGLPSIPGATK